MGGGGGGIERKPQTLFKGVGMRRVQRDAVKAVRAPTALTCDDEELGAVGVLPCVCHRHPPGPVVLELEVLVCGAAAASAAKGVSI